MWTITSYYNPIGYRRRLANYRLFRANLGVPLVTVELSFDGGFELAEDDSDILIQLSGGAVLWQKERLLNLAVKAVPAGVNNIAWLDCDVILQRADWIDEAKRQLDEFNVVQLFSDAIHLDREDYEKKSTHENGHAVVPGVASLPNARDLLAQRKLSSKKVRFNPGLAWAANRTLIEDHGFYDAAIVGGGDSLMAFAMYGRPDVLVERFALGTTRQRHYLKWAIPFISRWPSASAMFPGQSAISGTVRWGTARISTGRNGWPVLTSTRTSTSGSATTGSGTGQGPGRIWKISCGGILSAGMKTDNRGAVWLRRAR